LQLSVVLIGQKKNPSTFAEGFLEFVSVNLYGVWGECTTTRSRTTFTTTPATATDASATAASARTHAQAASKDADRAAVAVSGCDMGLA
jgi:hypothetical protein